MRTNAMMPNLSRTTLALATMLMVSACGGDALTSAPVASPPPASPPPASPTQPPATGAWQLVWEDDFDTLDPQRWTALHDCWGGGNAEQQCYTARPENVAIEDGVLVITARDEDYTGPAWPRSFGPGNVDPSETATRPFTSGKLTTEGLASWTYGRFEMRAKLPQGQGTWPAFWMLPENSDYGSWAASGEIDILETVNLGVKCPDCEPGGENSIFATLHYGGSAPANEYFGNDVSTPAVLDDAFHTYGVIWEEGRFTWTFDGEPYATANASDWFTTASADPQAPFDRDFHLILNLAIGGRWPEGAALGGVSTVDFPKRMEVDWVRVWQCGADAATGRGCTGN
ncbi:glycoside hydrolase family 16 protein [Aurantiacibacter poecillastricola]|uniref:glycoside hydrolase family 16 protein n=1 Tax=Aurantiacibacter poecillastricola TaxID=3064385 RepID=UPI00273DAD4B|nr:glycoside hydrolase family 16 protein [Aurantiacibacter sp. 219JJ12-13]MDP5260032.1 glycoside hydrolase family 16 protein [Aurantiacibacter sp. 219JJ12-13]